MQKHDISTFTTGENCVEKIYRALIVLYVLLTGNELPSGLPKPYCLQTLDFFRSGDLLPHFRPCHDTLENS